MNKRVWFFIFFVVCFFPFYVHGAQGPEVLVLPFEVSGQNGAEYLQKEIFQSISGYLNSMGASVKTYDEAQKFSEKPHKDDDSLKILGKKAGVDFVIYGSSIWSGENFILKARVVDSKGKEKPEDFVVKGSGPESILSKVQQLSTMIGGKILEQERITKIEIKGNKRIEDDAIKNMIAARAGNLYLPEKLSDDMKKLFKTGYFSDIRINGEKDPKGGWIVVFEVKERATIKNILIKGNSEIKDEDIKDAIDVKSGAIFNIFKIKQEISKIQSLYKEKNYHNAEIKYKIDPLGNNQADLEFIIDEGEKAMIKKIVFQGNHAFTSEELRNLKPDEKGLWAWPPFSWFTSSGEMGKMETTEEGFFSFLTSSGELKPETLSNDMAKLNAFYQNHGFIQARVADPDIKYKGDSIFITIRIEEGLRYRIGDVNVSGDLIKPKEELVKPLKIAKEEFVNRGALRKDVLALTDVYGDKGYFYADIYPRIKPRPGEKTADITFVIKKGKPVYFEKIIIEGNTSTRDKVIRRQLPIYEQELYNRKKLKRGIRNLRRLDYFKDVKVTTQKGSADDKMILKLGVEEKPTGNLSFGAGYSSVENLFFSASITERNLFGRGQILNLKTSLGATTHQFNASFTEPWLFDIPLSATVSLYNITTDYTTYDKDTTGGGLGFGYPVFDYTRLSLSYVYETDNYKNLTYEASDYVKGVAGLNVTSKLIARLNYDSRDRRFNPTEGSDHSLTLIYAGGPLGGDIGYSKYIAETGWYFPLFWDTVGFLHGKGGYVRENSGGNLPEEERFFLGGMSSLRGFGWRDVSPVNSSGVIIGGNKFVQFNFEYIFPIFKKAQFVGLVFYDTGNAFDNGEGIDFGNLRKSAGFGFRWYSPMGPLRIEHGYILDPKPGEDGGGRWEFTMGAAF